MFLGCPIFVLFFFSTCFSLFTECSQPLSAGAKELEEYGEIRDLIEKIRVLQAGRNVSQVFILLLCIDACSWRHSVLGNSKFGVRNSRFWHKYIIIIL